MKLRPNNYQGHGKKITHGFLGKQRTYINTGFKQLPELTEEERRQKLVENLKPYSFDPKKYRVVDMAHGSTSTPPPVETFYLLTAQGDALQTAGADNILWTT